MLFQLYGDGTIYKLIGWVLVFAGLVICNELARRSKFGGLLFKMRRNCFFRISSVI